MATTLDIITRAFRKVGITAHDDQMTADEAALGLSALNDMMHGWAVWGIDIAHADLALTDAFPMAAKWHEGAVYQLARRISPDFSKAGVDDDAWFRALSNAYVTVEPQTTPEMLMRTPSQRRFTVE